VGPLAADDVTVRGSLIEEHHGGVPEDLRPAEGVVRALKVVSQRFRLSGRALTPIPGAVRFREVDRMPNAFTHPDPDEMAREQWLEIGALVELESTRLHGLRDVPTGAAHLGSIFRAP
jgi:hypothetical protein